MAIIIIAILICLENLSIRIVRGDFSFLVVATLDAIFPISVFKPVPVTTHIALPVETVVPAKTIFFISLIATFLSITSIFLLTAILSPVKTDSSTVKLLHSIILISALILSPDVKNTISPTTKLEA